MFLLLVSKESHCVADPTLLSPVLLVVIMPFLLYSCKLLICFVIEALLSLGKQGVLC